VLVRRLWLTDFRNHADAALELAPGLTAIIGANGQGKTNLVEAIAYVATLTSFRGAPPDALVRAGATRAVVRAEIGHDDGRELLIEAELTTRGRGRVQVNRQRLARPSDLLGVLRVSVFSPDDLDLVKGGPAQRRGYLDTTLVALQPRCDSLLSDLDRVLRQRTTLLKQAGGRLTAETELTLDVWDTKLAEIGEQLGAERAALVDALQPHVRAAYTHLGGPAACGRVELGYEPPWRRTGLAAALAAGRADDVRRHVSLIGPHRDEVQLDLAGLPARTHASQGEQRTLALALRLGAHALVTEQIGSAPVLLLDDVFSELDPERSRALLHHMPPGQVVLTTASDLPEAARPQRVLRIEHGRVSVSASMG
jgi:DNA replication and repair protein RecF